MKTDSLLYRLFQEQPGLVFELAGWPLPVGAAYTLRAEEVKQTSFLEDLAERTDLTPGLRLLRLIIAEPAVAVSEAQALLGARGGPEGDPDWRGWVDLIETILVYKLPRLTREEIQRMLHLPDVELKQTRFYQDVFAEGRIEGRAEGRTEGQQQEAAALVLRLLRRRLGAVSGEVESRIRALPVAELEALGEAVLDWRTPAELIAWLQQRGERL